MKTTRLLLALFLGLVPLVAAEPPADFTVESPLTGAKFTLSKNRGKVVALHFLLKTECPFCLRHTHDFAALAATTPGVVHVFLKPDSEADIRKWAGKLSPEGLAELPAVYRDPEARLAAAYGVPDGYKFHGQVVRFPALIVLGPDGKELFRYVDKSNADRMSPADFTKKLAATPGAAR